MAKGNVSTRKGKTIAHTKAPSKKPAPKKVAQKKAPAKNKGSQKRAAVDESSEESSNESSNHRPWKKRREKSSDASDKEVEVLVEPEDELEVLGNEQEGVDDLTINSKVSLELSIGKKNC